MTPECIAAWRNYECKVNVTGYARRTQDAFKAGWHAATEAAVSVVLTPAVGHVCEASLTGRTQSEPAAARPSLCWICGKALPHDCVGDVHPQQPCWQEIWSGGPRGQKLGEISTIVQSWLDKQGHDRCWYYPELFTQLAAALGLSQRAPAELPPIEEFKEGCRRYQTEEYRLTHTTSDTHGPPREVEVETDFAASELRMLQGAAKRLAHTGRKWPIGTTPAAQAKFQADLKIPIKTSYHWGERLIAARTHRGLTLDALGAKLDPPRTRKDISAMEHGRRGLSVELCAQLADALDCDRLWLAGWTLEGAP